MATNLDLQEQEQLDELKAFWNQYGNLITWVLALALAGYAAFNGWNWWQNRQAAGAAAMYDELDKAAQAGDAERAAKVFGDLKERFGRTTYTSQAGLLTAKVQFDKGQTDAAQTSLAWVAEHAGDDAYKAMAQLRLAGVLLDKKAYDEALKQLDGIKQADFSGLTQDRRGDILLAQGKRQEAVTAYRTAYQAMDEALSYRRVVEAKLNSLGVATSPALAAAAAASGAGS